VVRVDLDREPGSLGLADGVLQFAGDLRVDLGEVDGLGALYGLLATGIGAVVLLLAKFQIIPMTSSMARLAGSLLRAKDENQIKAHFGDALIAASAVEVSETILTADRRSQ
jgi:hypothetical protein